MAVDEEEEKSGVLSDAEPEEEKTARQITEEILRPPIGVPDPTTLVELRTKRNALISASRGGLSIINSISAFRLREVGMYMAHFADAGERMCNMKMIMSDIALEENRLKLEISILSKVGNIPADAGKHIQVLITDQRTTPIMLSSNFGRRLGTTSISEEMLNTEQLKHSLVSKKEFFIPDGCNREYTLAVRLGLKRMLKSNGINYAKPKKISEFSKEEWARRSTLPDVVAYLPFYGDRVDRAFLFTIWNTVTNGKILKLYQHCAPPSSSSRAFPSGLYPAE